MTSLKKMAEQAYFDNDGKLCYLPEENADHVNFDGDTGDIGDRNEEPSINAGENKKQSSRGERGERGENPHQYSKEGGRKMGEKGRNSPLDSPDDHERMDYPVDSLGKLAGVCAYMRDEIQLPVETCGQSLLGAASLLTQGIYDVQTLAGTSPLSLYLQTVSESGDGKSTADGVALKEVSRHEHEDHLAYEKKLAEWDGQSKKEKAGERQPIAPYRLIKSGTIQGIVRSFSDGISSQGSFTAEAASMLSGWGMSAEQKANTMAGLNGFWDGGSVSIVRQGDGRTQLYDKRFCAHWLVQPSAARESLNDELFASIGLWPRFLVAWPEAMKPRSYKQFDIANSPTIKEYFEQCNILLTERYSVPEGKRNLILLSSGARSRLIKFWERMELSRNKNSKLHHVKPFCVRGAEQVCRIAGVLTAYENHPLGKTDFEITDKCIQDSIKLFMYSLDTWLWIFGKKEDLERQEWANTLHAWMLKQPGRRASETSMLKIAPKSLRSRHKRDTAISLLRCQGLIDKVVERMHNGGERVAHNEWRVLD